MILDDIIRKKREELAALPEPDLRSLHPSRRNFGQALKSGRSRVAIIAEIKKASPSAGVICRDFDPVRIAGEYERGGASAISVLTDASFFQGSLGALTGASETVGIPILRKDFIIDERQIYEARLAGADSLLLIAAVLDVKTMRAFLGVSRSLQMEPLVEIHDESEMENAVNAGALIVGINNRDLRTFEIRMDTTYRLAPLLPRNITIVAESGVEDSGELRKLNGVVDAALIGTSLMKSAEREALLRTFVEATAG